eukprot:TRINITY_DN4311_c0_g2_i2.p1 TRINITY_DN4311_c0_g2~~TRINITY_DN4311_c0_g2_i2.p1  ORF type:complete len:1018 (+),score=258.08 TRINITY_DN4311_c0_g2_i2:85-3138(+)
MIPSQSSGTLRKLASKSPSSFVKGLVLDVDVEGKEGARWKLACDEEMTVEKAVQMVLGGLRLSGMEFQRAALWVPQIGIYLKEEKKMSYYFTKDNKKVFNLVLKNSEPPSKTVLIQVEEEKYQLSIWDNTTIKGLLLYAFGGRGNFSISLAGDGDSSKIKLDDSQLVGERNTFVVKEELYGERSKGRRKSRTTSSKVLQNRSHNEPLPPNYIPTSPLEASTSSSKAKKKLFKNDEAISSSISPGEKLKLSFSRNFITCFSKKNQFFIFAGSLECILIYLLDNYDYKSVKKYSSVKITKDNASGQNSWADMVETFVLSYRKFYTPCFLFSTLRGFWEVAKQQEIQSEKLHTRLTGIIFFLLRWLDTQFEDFRGHLMQELQDWIFTIPDEFQAPLLKEIQLQIRPKPKPTQLLTYVDSDEEEESLNLYLTFKQAQQNSRPPSRRISKGRRRSDRIQDKRSLSENNNKKTRIRSQPRSDTRVARKSTSFRLKDPDVSRSVSPIRDPNSNSVSPKDRPVLEVAFDIEPATSPSTPQQPTPASLQPTPASPPLRPMDSKHRKASSSGRVRSMRVSNSERALSKENPIRINKDFFSSSNDNERLQLRTVELSSSLEFEDRETNKEILKANEKKSDDVIVLKNSLDVKLLSPKNQVSDSLPYKSPDLKSLSNSDLERLPNERTESPARRVPSRNNTPKRDQSERRGNTNTNTNTNSNSNPNPNPKLHPENSLANLAKAQYSKISKSNPNLTKRKESKKNRNTELIDLEAILRDLKVKNRMPKWDLLALNSASFAEQWTILDMKNLREIQHYTVFHYKRKEWQRMMERGKMLAEFVESRIVGEEEMEDRIKTISYFVQVALKFLAVNNFHALMFVLEALNAPNVVRLTKTFSKLEDMEPIAYEAFQKLKRLWTPEDFSFLKTSVSNQLQQLDEAVIPWLKVIDKDIEKLEMLQDFVFLDETPLLNYEKMYGMALIKKLIINTQKSLHCFNIDEDHQNNSILQTLLQNLPISSPEDRERCSRACED